MNERAILIFCSGFQGTAFTSLVQGHLDLIFATALRKVRDEDGAEEVAQNVFAVLMKKA